MNILEQIAQDKLAHIRNKKKQVSAQDLCSQIDCLSPNLRQKFSNSLKEKINNKKTAIIAEVKKASPSKGVICQDFDPLKIAQIYEKNGAACLSILTDEKYFQGHDDYLKQIAAQTNLPILRKDFMLDTYQILEAKAMGANCILLIMAMIDEKKAKELENFAHEIGLEVLIEIHDEEDLAKALKLQSPLLGINNRDLKTFKTSLNISKKLLAQIPKEIRQEKIIISESGINFRSDILELQEAEIYSFLVGESLLRQKNVKKALQDLLG